MTWQDAVLITLTVVDISALAVGLTVLRRVTGLVRQAGEAVHEAVVEGIEDAKRDVVVGLASAVAPALGELRTQVPRAVEAIRRDLIEAVGRAKEEGNDKEQGH